MNKTHQKKFLSLEHHQLNYFLYFQRYTSTFFLVEFYFEKTTIANYYFTNADKVKRGTEIDIVKTVKVKQTQRCYEQKKYRAIKSYKSISK